MAGHNVIVYSTPSCVYCKLAKAYFKEKGVDFKEIDVAADQKKAEEMIEKSGQMGVPVFVVSDDGKEEVIIGYDRNRLANTLGVTPA